MKFDPPLVAATLLRRYKRFLADVELAGECITVHCPNTGGMTNCIVEGSKCWLRDAQNPKRKYRYGWELATTPTGHIAGINSVRANALAEEAIRSGVIAELADYGDLKREVKIGDKSRLDFLLTGGDKRCYVEVKSVTLGVCAGVGLFPDVKSERALRHIQELIQIKRLGDRAVLLFCVQHTGIERVSPADEIDPDYGVALRRAAKEGVEILAYRADIDETEVRLSRAIPVLL